MTKDPIAFADFSRLDLRIGKVIKADKVVDSRKLVRIEVDFGEIGRKVVFAGIANICNPADLLEQNFIFIINLQPRKFFDEETTTMMLAADNQGKPILIKQIDGLIPGSIVK